MPGADLPDELFAHYSLGVEDQRLVENSLEFLRTRDVLDRFLPGPRARILDVGGGTGVYAEWLAGKGYEVHLVDAVPLHVEQARARADRGGGFSVAVGDARDLGGEGSSYHAVLLLGPLYHLIERSDRIQALREAARVVRPGGVVIGAAISRTASLLDGLARSYLQDPRFRDVVVEDLRSGQHRNPDPLQRPEWFTTAFFHSGDELAAEFDAADLAVDGVFGVEGPAWLLANLDERLADREQRDAILWAANLAERDPALLHLSSHLLAVGRSRKESGV